MEVSGHLPAQATLLLGKELPFPYEYYAGWAAQLVWWFFEKTTAHNMNLNINNCPCA
jgi:hypothetical protein